MIAQTNNEVKIFLPQCWNSLPSPVLSEACKRTLFCKVFLCPYTSMCVSADPHMPCCACGGQRATLGISHHSVPV